MKEIVFYILMFCIGTLFGSFFTLAIHRIPLHQDITHKRSYCPNCNHRLSFFDMIPILSYIFLGGKCRYCKKKIKPRYLILEVLTGIVFLLFAMSININFLNISTSKIVYLIFSLLYIAGLFIIGGIDKQSNKISKGLILYEIGISCIYMIYLYTVEQANIYRYVIYLFLMVVFLIIENSYLSKNLKDYYPLEILQLCMIMAIFEYELIFIYTVGLTLLTIAIECIIRHIKSSKNKVVKKDLKYYKDLPVGFYLCCSNIFVIIMVNFLACRGGI